MTHVQSGVLRYILTCFPHFFIFLLNLSRNIPFEFSCPNLNIFSKFKKIAYEKLETNQPCEAFENSHIEQGQIERISAQKTNFKNFPALFYIGVLIVTALGGFKIGERYSCPAVDSSSIYYCKHAMSLLLQVSNHRCFILTMHQHP